LVCLPTPSISSSARRVPRSSRNRRAGESGLLGTVFGNPIERAHWNKIVRCSCEAETGHKYGRRVFHLFYCGSKDDFGFDQGAEELIGILQAEDIRHEYISIPATTA